MPIDNNRSIGIGSSISVEMQIQKKRTESYNENTRSVTDDSKSNLITAEELSATLSQFEPLVSVNVDV